MIYCMRKLQSSIEKFILSAIIAVVAIIVSYFIYSSFYSTSSHIGVKSYLVQADFSNIYGNKTSIFILLKNNTEIGSNVLINEKITFSNGTSNSITVPFTLEISSQSGDGHLYYFTTSNFPTIANNSQGIKISNINILSGNSIIESQNNSIVYTSYYYTKSSLETIPLYYLNMSTSILNAGALIPGNGYYYAGSKVAIGEKPNTGYAFSGWLGYGNGNYTGSNQTSIITMNSNITEYAKYVKLVKMYVNATYNGIPVYINSALNTTTNGTIYLMPGVKYTLSIPRYIAFSNGTRYVFEIMQDDCGIPISPNSNSTTFIPSYTNYNCKFTINVVKLIRIYLNATYTGIPVYANGELIATTNEVVYLMPGMQETLSFPTYVSASNGERYAFENALDNCSIPIAQNSNYTTFVPSYSDYNCKFMANYVTQYLLLLNFNSSEGSVNPSSGWYNSGTSIEITTTPKNGYIFKKAIGSGTINYTGDNSQFYVTMDSPITENINFEPIVYVYVYSSSQSVPYSFLGNYEYNSTFYNGTTNSNFIAPAGSTLTLENPQVNWGERDILSISNSNCTSSGNSVILPKTGGASCVIYINKTIQYLFILNEFLNGGNESNNFKYGTVYLDGNPMTSNQTWINAGTNVTFYATNDKAGYAFQGFSGVNSSLDGVAYSEVSGTDSNPGVPIGYYQQFTAYPFQYSSGYNFTASKFPNAIVSPQIGPTFDYSVAQYTPIHIIMNNPVIENADYKTTSDITGNTISVSVNYKYYNLTEQEDYSGGWGSASFSEYVMYSTLKSGTETINFTNLTPYSNYSSGIGEETIYYLNYASYSSSSQYSPYGSSANFGYYYHVNNFTSSQVYYMPPEYQYIVDQIISKMQQEYPDERVIYYSNPYVGIVLFYVLNLQISFNLSGTKIYYNYNDTPSQICQYSYSYSYGNGYGGQQSNINDYYYGFSNYYGG